VTDATTVREVIATLPEPWSVDRIAGAAGVDRATARSRLQELVEAGELLSVEAGGDRLFYPDPVTSYLEHVGGARPESDERLADRAQSVRATLADWVDPATLATVEDLLRYHHAGRLVASSRLPAGVDVLSADWDVLVVLDTCRVDALRGAVDRLDGPAAADVASRVSRGSQTAEWLCQTFAGADGLDDLGYVSGNGWTKAVFEEGLRPDDDHWFDGLDLPTEWDVPDADAFGELVHAWQRDRGEYSTDVPWAPHPAPRTVTDHAVALGRERPDLERLVVHYKQPHAPYTVAAEREGRAELTRAERAPFDFLQAGGHRDAVWNAYRTDLAAALDEVAALCRNVEGTVAVTADHGEAFGEFGEFGHRPAMLHPEVKRVPWVTLSATDERARDGDLAAYQASGRDVDEQLEALGYL